MEENKSLSFDQLPNAVGELLTKVNTMMTRLDDIGQRIGNAPSENDHVLLTSERQVPSSERKSHRFMLTHLKDASHSTREGTHSTSSKTN